MYFYSVNVTYTSARKLYLLHCCSLLVALESLPFPRERAEPCTISTHPTSPWQLPSCRKGTCSPWKGGPPTATFSFPGSKMWALPLVAPGAEKRGGSFALLLIRAHMRSFTWHLQEKRPHQVCAFPRQRKVIFYGKQILKLHQKRYYLSPPSVPCARFLRYYAK